MEYSTAILGFTKINAASGPVSGPGVPRKAGANEWLPIPEKWSCKAYSALRLAQEADVADTAHQQFLFRPPENAYKLFN